MEHLVEEGRVLHPPIRLLLIALLSFLVAVPQHGGRLLHYEARTVARVRVVWPLRVWALILLEGVLLATAVVPLVMLLLLIRIAVLYIRIFSSNETEREFGLVE